MVESANQHVVAAGGDGNPGLKHRLVNVIGERTAGQLARPTSIARAWMDNNFTSTGRANRDFVRHFESKYTGQRCVIIGNGPSLKKTDLSLLRNEYTFGLNRIYLMFEELGFETNFHVVVNKYVVEQCADDFCAISAPLFTTKKNRTHLRDASEVGFLNNIPGPWFSPDASLGVWEGYTVTYVAMQLAYYMGFSSVILVGVDHRFAVQGKPNQLVESQGPDASHFDPRYFAKGFKWQLPDLNNSEVAYSLARRAFTDAGREIIDCTVEGALTIFPKMRLEEALLR